MLRIDNAPFGDKEYIKAGDDLVAFLLDFANSEKLNHEELDALLDYAKSRIRIKEIVNRRLMDSLPDED